MMDWKRIGAKHHLLKLLTQGKFYTNKGKIPGGFLVHKKLPDLNEKISLDQYVTIFDGDLVFIVENLGEKISTASKNKYITYKVLTNNFVGYIFVYHNSSKNWVEISS